MAKALTWLDCVQIVCNGEMTELYEEAMKPSLEEYKQRVVPSGDLEFSVWYDTKNSMCFGMDETYKHAVAPNKACFLTGKDEFLQHRRWGLSYLNGRYDFLLQDEPEFECSSEIFIQRSPHLQQFRDSRILIIGAGPTTNSAPWSTEDYDHIWSCNHFFLHPKIKDIPLSLVMLNNEVSPHHQEFRKYIKKHNPMCIIETSIHRSAEDLRTFKELGCDTVVSNTRLFTSAGSIPKMVAMAVLFGAKEVTFVGMDGYPSGSSVGDDSSHSFQIAKKMCGTIDHELYRRHIVLLWDYLLNDIGKDVKYQNLGEGHPWNITTNISQQMFSLQAKSE